MNALSPPFEEVCLLLIELLALDPERAVAPETPLIGAIPEFDSIAVVSFLTAIEDLYGCDIDDADLSAEAFSTFGSLYNLVVASIEG